MNDTLSPTRPLWNETQLALHLNRSVRTVQAWRVRGGGPAFKKVGRSVVYDPRDVEQWLADCTRTNTVGGAA